MPALIAVLFLAVSVFYRLAAPREMEIRQYRDSSQVLVWRALAAQSVLGFCLAATAAGCFAIPGYPLTKHVPSLVLMRWHSRVVLLYLREKHTAYLTLPPRQERPQRILPHPLRNARIARIRGSRYSGCPDLFQTGIHSSKKGIAAGNASGL